MQAFAAAKLLPPLHLTQICRANPFQAFDGCPDLRESFAVCGLSAAAAILTDFPEGLGLAFPLHHHNCGLTMGVSFHCF
jgi:hypothetical protein